MHKATTETGVPDSHDRLACWVCTADQLDWPEMHRWAEKLGQVKRERKVWEIAYIMRALEERGLLGAGKCALGFGVGREPIPALLAAAGCDVLATDQFAHLVNKKAWVETGQHASGVGDLAYDAVCARQELHERVRFRPIDMRALPGDLGTFDAVWSNCSLEHIGGIRLSVRFVREAMQYVRPGGVAVHTVEFNLSSDDHTIMHPDLVVFRRKDLHALFLDLERDGFALDWYFPKLPRPAEQHLGLKIGSIWATSYGIIIARP